MLFVNQVTGGSNGIAVWWNSLWDNMAFAHPSQCYFFVTFPGKTILGQHEATRDCVWILKKKNSNLVPEWSRRCCWWRCAAGSPPSSTLQRPGISDRIFPPTQETKKVGSSRRHCWTAKAGDRLDVTWMHWLRLAQTALSVLAGLIMVEDLEGMPECPNNRR